MEDAHETELILIGSKLVSWVLLIPDRDLIFVLDDVISLLLRPISNKTQAGQNQFNETYWV